MTIEKRENLENRQVRLTIRVDADTFQQALADCYEQVKATFPMKGKAGRDALREHYGEDFLYQEAVNATYPQALIAAVQAEDIALAGTPQLTVEQIGEDGYTFAAMIDLYPEVQLGQYRGLTADWPATELTDEDVEGAIAAYLQERVLPSYPERAAMGDEVLLDFEGFVDGVPFDGGKGENYPLVLGSNTFIPGFEEQVAGMKADDVRDITVTFPTDYVAALAGKEAVFRITVHEITRYTPPKMDDAFAVSQGFADAAALRRDIMERTLLQKEAQGRSEFAQALIEQVLSDMETVLPDSMVEGQLDGLMNDLRMNLQAQGIEMGQYLEMAGLTLEDLRQRARQDAENAAHYELAMMEIARLEQITVTDSELDEKYCQLSEMYHMPEEQIRAQLPPIRLQHDLKLAKAQAVIVDSAKRK